MVTDIRSVITRARCFDDTHQITTTETGSNSILVHQAATAANASLLQPADSETSTFRPDFTNNLSVTLSSRQQAAAQASSNGVTAPTLGSITETSVTHGRDGSFSVSAVGSMLVNGTDAEPSFTESD